MADPRPGNRDTQRQSDYMKGARDARTRSEGPAFIRLRHRMRPAMQKFAARESSPGMNTAVPRERTNSDSGTAAGIDQGEP